MSTSSNEPVRPAGGLRAGKRLLRPWSWNRARDGFSDAVRCKREQWYLARGLAAAPQSDRAEIVVRFLSERAPVHEQLVRLHAGPSRNGVVPLLGWVQTPTDASHVQLMDPATTSAALATIELHPVAERDPKCHPGANVPRWSTHKPPFPLDKLVLPHALAVLADHVPQRDVIILDRPRSLRQLAGRVVGAVCVVDPRWVRELSITLADVERLAAMSYMIIDIETFVGLLAAAGHAGIRCTAHASTHGIMSARVIYSDLATRGFALEDAFPFAAIDERGRFRTRAIDMTRDWKRYSDAAGFAPLLASETPSDRSSGHILAAVRAIGRGELLASDLPWLVAEREGPLLAPRIARHLLRMHLGGKLPDHVQYWNRWDETAIVVRDVIDLTRRYPPLRALRWSGPARGDERKTNAGPGTLARLGLSLPPVEGCSQRHLIFSTGRIDNAGPHDGVAPEPLAIFMRWLAREQRERTPWAARHLAGLTVTWQFDTALGLKYALNYDAAPPVGTNGPETRITVRGRRPAEADTSAGARAAHATIVDDVGLHGDGTHEFQDRLTRLLCTLIERY